ncbi:hypothetical protein Gotur_023897 [Gossypium turneri]
MVTALKKEINELKGELKIFKVAIGNVMLASKTKPQEMDVPKSKAFKGARSATHFSPSMPRMKLEQSYDS